MYYNYNYFTSKSGCPFSMSYWTMTETASKHILCFSLPCLNRWPKILKNLKRVLTVSCLDLIRAKNFLFCLNGQVAQLQFFLARQHIQSPQLLSFPRVSWNIKNFFPICFFSFVVPPQNIVISCLLAGCGPFVHTILLNQIATATSYARPALLLLVSYHSGPGFVGTSFIVKCTPSTEKI